MAVCQCGDGGINIKPVPIFQSAIKQTLIPVFTLINRSDTYTRCALIVYYTKLHY
jgi:hypothetical protein